MKKELTNFKEYLKNDIVSWKDAKNKLEEKGRRFILNFLAQIKLPEDIRLTIDVDPIDIL